MVEKQRIIVPTSVNNSGFAPVTDFATADFYKEYTYVIVSGRSIEIKQPFDCLFFMQGAVAALFCLGENPQEWAFGSVGTGVKFERVFDRIRIRNPSTSNISVTIALALGNIITDFPATATIALASKISSSQVVVDTTATSLSNGGNPCFIDAGSSDLYVGDATVDIATGYLVRANQSIKFNGNDKIYGIRSAGSATAYVMEWG